MDQVTSLLKLLDTFKSSNIVLSKEEEEKLNTVFFKVDKWDKNGKCCPKGDSYLNAKEYYLFSKLIENTDDLYEKFTQTGLYSWNKDRYTLENLFLENSVDALFINSLPEKDVLEFTKDISFERYGYQIDKKKAKQFFNIQLQLLRNNNCYTEDLEVLANNLLAEYSHKNHGSEQAALCLALDSLKTHINDRLAAVKSDKPIEIKEPNGKIDADFKQGHTGDCWLLASIKALASDEKGLEKLNNMISVQKDGEKLTSVTVHLQGKDYVISSEELHSAVEYSTGDLDVRALEIAVNRFCLENSFKDITAGGYSGFGYSILMGDMEQVKEFAKKKPQDFGLHDDFKEDLKANSRVGTIGGAYPNTYAINAETGEKVKLVQEHEYAITGSDSEFVYLANSHDTSQKLKLNVDDVLATFANGYLYNIS